MTEPTGFDLLELATPYALHAISDTERAAVDRQLPDGRTLQPGQAITQQDAVRAYTVAAARSLGAPAGGLAAGEPADFVVCDGDPFAPATRVTQTWIAGEQAWPE